MREFAILAAAVMTAGPAMAADESETPSAEAQASPSSTVDAGQIQDIVVTAQRRSESVQRSSLSIQVLSGEALKRAAPTRAEDLNTLVPGMQIASVGATTQISVRGISDNSSNPLGNPSVAFNVDGIYVGRPTSISTNFYDIARIEVLKGPQGTLYGRNASGGAVNLITNAPKLGEDSGYFEIEAGNYALKRVTGAFNKALTNTVAVRASFLDTDRDGYLSDGSSDAKSTAGRIRALWQPSSDVSLMLNVDLANQRGFGEGWVVTPRIPGQDPWTGVNDPVNAARILAGTPPPLQSTAVYNGTPKQDNSFLNVSAQLDWNLGPAKLTIIPAYRHAKEDYEVWSGFNYFQRNNADQYTLEARLGNSSKNLKWVVGGYYYDDRQDVHAGATASLLVQSNRLNYRPTTKSYAAFGEATYSVSPAFRVIGGIRYTEEKKAIDGQAIDDSILAAGAPPAPIAGKATFRSTTWKAGIEYDLLPGSMFFANASTGFKAGGLNPAAVAGNSAYRPEKITAYVAGLRNRFLDNRLQVNVEGFYYDYKDKQESAIAYADTGLFFLTSNAGKARIYGGSVDVTLRLTSHDTISAFAEYNNNKYNTFVVLTPTFAFNPAQTTCLVTPGAVNTAIDCSGRPLPKAPEWVGSFAYEHRFDLSNGANLTAAADAQFSSSQWLSTDYVPGEQAGRYALVNAALTFNSSSGAWSVTAYMKNITDVATYKNANELPFQQPLVVMAIGAPRTFGGRVRFSF